MSIMQVGSEEWQGIKGTRLYLAPLIPTVGRSQGHGTSVMAAAFFIHGTPADDLSSREHCRNDAATFL